MRTKIFLTHLILGALMLTTGEVVGQSTTPGNVAALNTDFLGWNTNAGNNFPLRVRHDLNQEVQLWTNGVNRMRLLPSVTGQTINGYTGLNLTGNVGIGLFNNPLVSQPFSLLHLDAGGFQDSGFRPWMQSGVTITRQSDQGYFGLKDEGGASNHTVIAWSDNTLTHPGPDRLKFIFVANNVAANGIAGQLDGLEAARFSPDGGGNQTFFGVGDWFSAGVDPTERVDLLDGRLRIRQLPDDAEADAEYKVMVVDDTNDPNERGVVKWRSINLNADCDWVEQNQFPNTPPHVSNTYDNSNCTWDRRHGVGIGVPIPKSKLYVYHWDNSLLSPTAITADARFDLTNAQQLFGLYSQARPSSSTTAIQNQQATGAFGQAINSRSSVGVHGFGSTCAASEGTASEVIGVKGVATGCERAAFVAGLYGEGTGAQNAANEWAAYVNGRGYIANGPWQPSDGQLKTDVQPLGAADGTDADPILSLPVHTYQYNTDAFPSMNLPTGQQAGFLAGELEALIPEAVMSMTHPAKLDSLGNEIASAIDFKAINPMMLLPYLVKSLQRQESEIALLRSQVASCCTASLTDNDHRMVPATGSSDAQGQFTPAQERLLQIAPNPFTERTTLYCNLERGGRMMLLVNSADGRDLVVLSEGQREAGEFRFDWQTGHLAPGLYYVTLLLDGEQLVKRAVKVQQ